VSSTASITPIAPGNSDTGNAQSDHFSVRSLMPEINWRGTLFKNVWVDWFVRSRAGYPAPENSDSALAVYELFSREERLYACSRLDVICGWKTISERVLLPLPEGTQPRWNPERFSHREGVIMMGDLLANGVCGGHFRLHDDNLVQGERWALHERTMRDRPFDFEDRDAPPGIRTLTQYRDLWCVRCNGQAFLYQQTPSGFQRIRTIQDLVHEPKEVFWGGQCLAEWRTGMAHTLLHQGLWVHHHCPPGAMQETDAMQRIGYRRNRRSACHVPRSGKKTRAHRRHG